MGSILSILKLGEENSSGFMNRFLICLLSLWPSLGLSINSQLPSNSLTYEWTKNSPIFHSQDRLEGKYTTYAFGFRHHLNPHWSVGVSVNFRSFWKKSQDVTSEIPAQELSFLSFNHETHYIIRLYHPSYLLVGPKFHYMIPSQKSRFPVLKDPEFQTEISTSISLVYLHVLDGRYTFTARIDRWRGTKTNKFHAVESAVGLQYHLGED